MKDYKGVLITGASSGIGEAMAIQYARTHGDKVFLALTGRNVIRLQNVRDTCVSYGAKVEIGIFDVCETETLQKFVLRMVNDYDVDVIVANAGVSEATLKRTTYEESWKDLFDVNVTGAMNTVTPAIPIFKKRGRGQLVVTASLASFYLYTAYGASKAAVKRAFEALRVELEPHGIEVNCICPGLVDTRMADAIMDGAVKQTTLASLVPTVTSYVLTTSAQASEIIIDGLERDVECICFPRHQYYLVALMSSLPERLQKLSWSLFGVNEKFE
ncbi:hypothetical protein SARC_07487 [Sphaeroforma arctica JP610]|uniref:Uncharacterized protein n=1 Tax=Sphaeroforma arctica JP610 TaxID=667725 RepID=A0A0L0FW40_9EUKA|nr:hypothetical protein SARC_07487 [Sphaeroforma arctica JP610]KNC80148.1 hypothetical protein SARC_07487 [Sphaeroforma arctica JP610]|eukprot:XP_014154050.1 hypothetical protein SARC_07487 [Sphaeroforma arctica JP610]